jgi:hypothetical protein
MVASGPSTACMGVYGAQASSGDQRCAAQAFLRCWAFLRWEIEASFNEAYKGVGAEATPHQPVLIVSDPPGTCSRMLVKTFSGKDHALACALGWHKCPKAPCKGDLVWKDGGQNFANTSVVNCSLCSWRVRVRRPADVHTIVGHSPFLWSIPFPITPWWDTAGPVQDAAMAHNIGKVFDTPTSMNPPKVKRRRLRHPRVRVPATSTSPQRNSNSQI